MNNIKEIMSLVFVGVGILAYIITTILAIKRKKANGEKINVEETLATIANDVLQLIKTAEASSPSGGGADKFKSVLNATKLLCQKANVDFDQSYWTDFINNGADLINANKKDPEAEKSKGLPLE
ncbi:MAG: hypothetical protein K2O94_07245 [Clostridiales bacterium]|nr:hypothetical protein [Clostridiales bacterium]